MSLNSLIEQITNLKKQRVIIAVAGAPGSGKSTFSEKLRTLLVPHGRAEILAMDGYHFDDNILNARGHRPRKGAPFTFDIAGFGHVLSRLANNAEREIAVPVFDRDIEISRNAARIISSDVKYIIAEGNYLLLGDQEWSKLRANYDLTIYLEVPIETLKTRLTDRWLNYNYTPEMLDEKLNANDLPNAKYVIENSDSADFTISEHDAK